MQAADFTLERMAGLVTALGNPQQAYPSLHIAGTNGKGSVLALCEAALLAQGLKVGAFTSPHLRGALQGIQVGGQPAAMAELEESFEGMRPQLAEREDWTHFEVVTALAFVHFARVGVEAAVVEVGLGGRLDATNVLEPRVSVITPIDLDHTSILGDSVAAIASEKAGIIKEGVPVVMAPQTKEAETVLRAAAADKHAALFEVGKDFEFDRGAGNLSGQRLTVTRDGKATQLRIAMLGAHQASNAATAFAALQVAAEQGLYVSPDAIERGFAAARWPARFEVVRANPPMVLDAAHSPHAARALAAALDEYFPGRKAVLVLGVSGDKDLQGLMEPLLRYVRSALATQSVHARAMPAGELAGKLAAMGLQVEARAEPAEALRLGLARVADDELVLVCGSVFLVEQVRELLVS